jgi:hypothetical protein
MDPKLVALLQKLEADDLADLSNLLIPAIAAEIEDLSPLGAKAIEVVVFAAAIPAAQAALASLLAKVPVV